MAKYFKTFLPTDFQDAGDGRFYAEIPAAVHNLGINYSCTRALRRKSNNVDWENLVTNYEIKGDGGFVIFTTDRPAIMRVYLQGDEA